MKELSIEEKAKRYDEAIERAKEYLGDCMLTRQEYVEKVFPELKESEDEKWRNWLIGHLKGYINQTDDKYAEVCKKAIAWLEKQGEQKETLCDKCRREQPSHFCQDITALGRCALEHQSKQKPVDKVEPMEHSYMTANSEFFQWIYDRLKYVYNENPNVDYMLSLKERIEDMKKPVDKVESKFKVGDWIVNNNGKPRVFRVEKQGWPDSIISSSLGNQFINTFTLDKQYHLWTIEDANEGDVLVFDDIIMIFKNIKTVCTANTYILYCDGIVVDDWCDFGHNAHPATKEQRDLLFQKMKEAGYEWDAGKKELKKIEQKPTDKVEPKFKVGDWVVLPRKDKPDYLWYIDRIKDDCYWNDASKAGIKIAYADKECYLWTIEDAKDGDVLAFDNDNIVIFKDLYNASTFHSYCHIEDGILGISKDDMPDWWEGYGFHPATKEQCSLLFQKMKEAGYEWDAEKKELKKIEQNPAWSEEDGRIRRELIRDIDIAMPIETAQRYITWIKKQGKQNSAWSEEDEYIFNKILNWIVIVNPTSSIFEELPKEQFIERLKSLKDRVQPQPKQEWDEEDEKKRKGLIKGLEDRMGFGWASDPFSREEYIDWLKSLKPNHWKPSDEMLDALYRVTPENVMEKSEDEMLLDKLYQGLKYGKVLSEK